MSWQTLREKATRLRKEWFEESDDEDPQAIDLADDDDEDYDIWEGGDSLPGAGPRVLHINFTDPDDEPYVDYELRATLRALRRAEEIRGSVPLG